MATLRTIKRDICTHYGVAAITTVFDGGWAPGRGDTTLRFRNVQFAHPTNPARIITANFASNGYVRVFTCCAPH